MNKINKVYFYYTVIAFTLFLILFIVSSLTDFGIWTSPIFRY